MDSDKALTLVFALGSVVVLCAGVSLFRFAMVMAPIVGDSIIYFTVPDLVDGVLLDMPFKVFLLWLVLPMVWALYRGARVFMPPTIHTIYTWLKWRGYTFEMSWGPKR